ncbi:uncharacterized protein LOC111870131 isoform X1 [Cryptotermes secundus]|uniref:uncharacterized protein LOC111870131 isoform X1 n=1 Tax=Cryptotermes secundus TaxID=105785 RepID=UPI000CD7C4C8|nr:uncharacterized protein LOC111870131 isoform X1 [Cryptotermes secundus]
MPTNSGESERACSNTEHPGDPGASSISDETASSTNWDISNLPEITKPPEVSRDAPETSPFTETFETSGRLEENEKAESSPEEGLKVFLTNEYPVYSPDAAPLCAAAEATICTSKGNKQSNLLAGPMDATGAKNGAFQLDEAKQQKDDVQIQVVSSTSTARRQNVLLGWDVLKSWSLLGLLAGFILWAAIFFPLLLNGII